MRIRRPALPFTAALVLLVTLALLPGVAPASAGVWLAGDFHVHTTYSHDVCSTPPDPEHCHDGDTDFYTWGWTPGEQIQNAEMRGLDFVALTDHNTVEQQSDPGYRSDAVTLVDAYENSMRGHAQMLGASHLYPGPEQTAADVQAIADALRADGGSFQINHPGDGGMGEGDWSRAYGTAVVPESVEVWNIGPWTWQPPAPSANDNDRAIRFWETFLDAGHHVGATGGSDNHWRSTFLGQGVGQPTTWVYATDDSQAAILAGVRAGRTSISMQPPAFGGARAYLETTDGAMVGDTVARSSTFRIRVDGAPGATVRVLGSRGLVLLDTIATGFEQTFTIPADAATTWLRAEVFAQDARDVQGKCPAQLAAQTTLCTNRLNMLAMTSAIFLAP